MAAAAAAAGVAPAAAAAGDVKVPAVAPAPGPAAAAVRRAAPKGLWGWLHTAQTAVWDALKSIAGIDDDLGGAPHRLYLTPADDDAGVGDAKAPQTLADAQRCSSLQTCLAFVGSKQPQLFADVTFVVADAAAPNAEPHRFPGHRALFAARSRVFERLLYPAGVGVVAQPQQPLPAEVTVHDVSPAVWQRMSASVYADRVALTDDSVLPTLQAAKRYGLELLRRACTAYLRDQLSAATAMALFAGVSAGGVAAATPDAGSGGGASGRVTEWNPHAAPDEEALAFAFVLANANDCLSASAPAPLRAAFAALPRAKLRALLSSDDLDAPERVVFAALQHWIHCAEQKRRAAAAVAAAPAAAAAAASGVDVKGDAADAADAADGDSDARDAAVRARYSDLIGLIRFGAMPLTDVADAVAPSRLLSKDQLLQLYTFLGSDRRTATTAPFLTAKRVGSDRR